VNAQLASVVIVLVSIALLIIAFMFMKLHGVLLRGRRRGDNAETFKAYFTERAYPPMFLDSTYKHFQQLAAVRDFPVHPTDKLGTVYGLAEDDLLETLAELRRLACGDPTLPDELPAIETVEDAVRYVMSLGSSDDSAKR
jgi:hypothetical protein